MGRGPTISASHDSILAPVSPQGCPLGKAAAISVYVRPTSVRFFVYVWALPLCPLYNGSHLLLVLQMSQNSFAAFPSYCPYESTCDADEEPGRALSRPKLVRQDAKIWSPVKVVHPELNGAVTTDGQLPPDFYEKIAEMGCSPSSPLMPPTPSPPSPKFAVPQVPKAPRKTRPPQSRPMPIPMRPNSPSPRQRVMERVPVGGSLPSTSEPSLNAQAPKRRKTRKIPPMSPWMTPTPLRLPRSAADPDRTIPEETQLSGRLAFHSFVTLETCRLKALKMAAALQNLSNSM